MKLELIEQTRQNELESNQSNLDVYIGPAKYLERRGKQVLLSVRGSKIWAQMALAYDYSPEEGDTLLVMGKSKDWYVTGVIEGTGSSRWVVPNDLNITAPKGSINLSAAKGIRINTPKLDFISKKIDVVTELLIEKVGTLQQTVADVIDVQAKRVQVKVEETHRVSAKRIRQKAVENVKLLAKKIHLG